MNKPKSSLSQFIEEYPLYSKFGTDQPIEAADLNNLAFNFFCKHEKEVQPFRLEAIAHNGTLSHADRSPQNGTMIDFTEMFSGICQSCLNYRVNIIVNGTTQLETPRYFIRKIGQYPSPEAAFSKLPDEVTHFLNEESQDLYRKGLKSLELEHGNGALVYFKKMIAHEVSRIIEALTDPYFPGGRMIAEAFANYKEQQQKTRFIEDITPHLPKSLQEHGANSLLILHDVASMSVDELTEAECLKKAKDIDTLFRYLLRKIYAERNDNLSDPPPGKYFLRYR